MKTRTEDCKQSIQLCESNCLARPVHHTRASNKRAAGCYILGALQHLLGVPGSRAPRNLLFNSMCSVHHRVSDRHPQLLQPVTTEVEVLRHPPAINSTAASMSDHDMFVDSSPPSSAKAVP